MSGRTQTRTVALALVVVLGALVSGCGTRWSDRQRAAVVARYRGGSAAAQGAVTAGDQTAAAETTSEQSTAGASPEGASGTGGTGATATGPAASASAGPAGPAAASAKPCAAASTAPGITAKDITLGSISTLSGAVPGLGASALAAVRAYVAFRNSNGGVCGRRLMLKSADDGMDNGRYRAALAELSSQVIGIAGGLGGGDAGGIDVAESTKIPIVSTPISTAFEKASTVFDMNPAFANVNAPIGKYKYLYEQGVRKAALVIIAVDQTRQEMYDKQKPQMIASGIKVVHEQEVPLSTLSFDSAARGVANSGADYLLFISDPGQSASMAKSMRDTRYKLKFEEYLVAYGSNFIELAGSAADGTSSWVRTLPNEDGGTNPEQANFLRWMRQVVPDSVTDTFAGDAWAATKAFVDGLDALPGPISREALVAHFKSISNYDAGGFLAPIALGPKLNKGCFVGMKVVAGKWKRLTPAQGFLC